MTEQWHPFGYDEREEQDYDVLVPGVPGWLREPLIAWASARFAGTGNERWVHTSVLLDVQNILRIELGALAGSASTDGDRTRQRLRNLPALDLLRVVDLLLSRQPSGAPSISSLEGTLTRGRSAYTVGTRAGRRGLVDRVPAGVRMAAVDVAAKAVDAGPLLARAWAHVHGLVPNDTAGYADAVRAVEAVAIPSVLGNDHEATLGRVIDRMRRDGDWRLPLREHEFAPSAEMLVQMLRTLWRGHRDRHGNNDYSDVTHVEAEAAVALAVTLVAWFDAGVVQRRPIETDG